MENHENVTLMTTIQNTLFYFILLSDQGPCFKVPQLVNYSRVNSHKLCYISVYQINLFNIYVALGDTQFIHQLHDKPWWEAVLVSRDEKRGCLQGFYQLIDATLESVPVPTSNELYLFTQIWWPYMTFSCLQLMEMSAQ